MTVFVRRSGLALLLSWVTAVSARDLQPYEADDWTLHLWHLDETGPPFADAGSHPLELHGLLCGARAGQEGMVGFGSSVSFHHFTGSWETRDYKGAILLAAPELANHGADNAPDDFTYAAADGAFTLEALVRFAVPPSDIENVAGGLLTMDGDTLDHRIFNFRVERSGFLAFIPLVTYGTGGGGALAAIPTTGPHAVNTHDWFHLAVTYDGNEGTPNNLTLYWTRLDEPRESAHVIGHGILFDDLLGVSDFALGNEARGHIGEEPFPGLIDEVRISSVARDRTDFLFVPERQRRTPDLLATTGLPVQPLRIELSSMLADQVAVDHTGEGPIALPPETRRLDFDFSVDPDQVRSPVRFRCRLKGLQEEWTETGRGMWLLCEVLDAEGRELSQVRRPFLGASPGWRTGVEDSAFHLWSEPVFVAGNARAVRITFSSGAADNAGTAAIDEMKLIRSGPESPKENLLGNFGFERGEQTHLPHGTPSDWKREGTGPNIARLVHRGDNPALALVDGDDTAWGAWTSTVAVSPPPEGEILILEGREKFNVIGGQRNRATYTNVPPGDYVFEVVAATVHEDPVGSAVAVPFSIRAPLWAEPWFWASTATVVVGLVALTVVADLRRRQSRKLGVLRVQNALAGDRARIARDMHDDLGTRITRLTMNLALLDRDIGRDVTQARERVGTLSAAARDLVTSMDGLVWSIDPANDNLDEFAERLARLSEEVLEGSAVRCDLDIPMLLPDWPMRAAPRHHLFLAVKEALHNLLRHAGPCRAKLSLRLGEGFLEIVIEDDGRGFDPSAAANGNGLANLAHRMEHIGGACRIESEPGRGTRIFLNCSLKALRKNPDERR